MARENESRIPKIVCIDDDAPMIELLTLILKVHGFEGVGAQSGPEGLELIAKVKPDLVLLDIVMPGMDGWEVYQKMKADKTMRNIPVIVVTCRVAPIDEVLGRYIAKVDDYIRKPFSPAKLEEAITRVLSATGRVLQQQDIEHC